jgi:hypothetical protein
MLDREAKQIVSHESTIEKAAALKPRACLWQRITMTKKKDHSGTRRDSEKKKRSFSKSHPRAAELVWDALCLGAIAAATVLVYHGATHYFFAQDDFTSLWIAREAPKTFWRILSSFVYFRAASSLLGLNPVAFHVAAFLFHILNGFLVFLVARAFSVGRSTSLVAAILFAVHPSLYVPVYTVSSIGEIISCLFVLLAALYLLKARRPEGLVGVPVVCLLFVASLLSKETTIAFPILAIFIFVVRGVKMKKAAPVLLALFAVAVVYGTLFYSANIFGIKGAFSSALGTKEAPTQGGAYATTLGPELITSLQTYFKWSLNIFDAWKGVQFNVLDKRALGWLFLGIAFFLLLIARRGPTRATSAYCIFWFLLTLLPVIPLTSHPYHYYLYVPLAGLCPALSVSLARWFKRSRGEALASVCIIVFFVANSTLLMSKIERATVGDSARRKDPTFDRAIVAGNLISDLRELQIPRGTKLLLISPLKEIREGKVSENTFLVWGGSYWDNNLRSAVAEGLGIRLFFSQVDTVAFANEATQEFNGFLAIGYLWDGHLRFDTLQEPRH